MKNTQRQERLVWDSVAENKWQGLESGYGPSHPCSPETCSSWLCPQLGRDNVQPQMQPFTPWRTEIPSRRLVLLHIHGCKSGPRTTALDSEILDLWIMWVSCKFLQTVLAQRANRQWAPAGPFLLPYLRWMLLREKIPYWVLLVWGRTGLQQQKGAGCPVPQTLSGSPTPFDANSWSGAVLVITVSPATGMVPGTYYMIRKYTLAGCVPDFWNSWLSVIYCGLIF